jgi:hypothetical protein
MQTCDICGEPAQSYYRNGIEWLCDEHRIPDDDDWFIPIKNELVVVVDRDGLELWKKYRWHFNWSTNHLYRRTWKVIDGKVKYNIILFWTELLDFPKPRSIYFLNGNNLDVRRKNLYCC